MWKNFEIETEWEKVVSKTSLKKQVVKISF